MFALTTANRRPTAIACGWFIRIFRLRPAGYLALIYSPQLHLKGAALAFTERGCRLRAEKLIAALPTTQQPPEAHYHHRTDARLDAVAYDAIAYERAGLRTPNTAPAPAPEVLCPQDVGGRQPTDFELAQMRPFITKPR